MVRVRRSTKRGVLSSVRAAAPELIAAASDNDPTNVGTAVSVGARTAYQLSWVTVLVAPLLGVLQSIAAQLGSVAHDDLQSLTVRRYGRGVASLLLVSVVTVNVITIAADLQAGAAGLGQLAGVDPRWLVAPLALVLGGLLVVGKYHHVVGVLRYLLLGFLAFGAAVVLARPDWVQLLRGSLLPSVPFGRDTVSGALALLGTTLTSYVFIWETVERGVEGRPARGAGGRGRLTTGAVVGAVLTALILWCMLAASAATLGRHHQTVSSAQQAAQALRPLAGPAAADLFAAGLLVSALVALPVLLATTAHVVGAHFGWRRGLSESIGAAPGFYATLAVSVGLALAVTLAQVSVVAMLVVASILGGLGTPIAILLLVGLARDAQVMGAETISPRLAIAGWTVVVVVGGLGLLFLVGAGLGWL